MVFLKKEDKKDALANLEKIIGIRYREYCSANSKLASLEQMRQASGLTAEARKQRTDLAKLVGELSEQIKTLNKEKTKIELEVDATHHPKILDPRKKLFDSQNAVSEATAKLTALNKAWIAQARTVEELREASTKPITAENAVSSIEASKYYEEARAELLALHPQIQEAKSALKAAEKAKSEAAKEVRKAFYETTKPTVEKALKLMSELKECYELVNDCSSRTKLNTSIYMSCWYSNPCGSSEQADLKKLTERLEKYLEASAKVGV